MSKLNLKDELSKINALVEPVIHQCLTENIEPSNTEAVYHQIKSGGKRIRPALVLHSGQLFGGDLSDLLHVAASVEIMHNATLVIDDIIDHSVTRRDQPTTWKKYGKSIAECVSLDYMASVFSALAGVKNGPKIINLYAKTLKDVIDGEIKDILFERSGRDDEPFVVNNRYKDISVNDYLGMIGQKTAILLSASCMSGAMCAGASESEVKIMGDYGFNIGMAFQIRDDILDIFGDEKEFGKKIGKDIIEKKMGNIVILSAIEQLDKKQASKITNLLKSKNDITDKDVKEVKNLIDETNAKDYANKMADNYTKKALKSLNKLPGNPHKSVLFDIAKYIIGRNK